MNEIRTRLSVWWTRPSLSRTASARVTGGPTTAGVGVVAAGGSEDVSGRILAGSRRPAKGGKLGRTGEATVADERWTQRWIQRQERLVERGRGRRGRAKHKIKICVSQDQNPPDFVRVRPSILCSSSGPPMDGVVILCLADGFFFSLSQPLLLLFVLRCCAVDFVVGPEDGSSACPRTSGSGSGWRGVAVLTGGTASGRTAKRRCRSSRSGR